MIDGQFEYKMAIVVRSDLKLSKGKLAGQCAHAAVGCVNLTNLNPSKDVAWFEEGQKKVILKVENQIELLKLEKRAQELEIPHYLVKDFGYTELEPNTITCIGLGPDTNERMDLLTKDLKLL